MSFLEQLLMDEDNNFSANNSSAINSNAINCSTNNCSTNNCSTNNCSILKGGLSRFPRPEATIDFAKSDCSSSGGMAHVTDSSPSNNLSTASFIRDRLKLFSKNDERIIRRPRSLQPRPGGPVESLQRTSDDSQRTSERPSKLQSLLPKPDTTVSKPALESPVSSNTVLLRASRENKAPAVVSNVATPAGKPVREQLAVMSGQIKGFESQLLTEIEHRKQASAGRLAQIRDAVNQLRRTLDVEVQRRIVMQKELHTTQTKDIQNLKTGLHELIEERKQHVTEFIDQFNCRLAQVETQTTEQLAQQEAKLGRIAKAVDLMATQIESFKSRLTSDIQLRRQRSETLFEKLAELEKQTHTKASIEAGLRERDRDAITKQVAELKEEQLQATTALQDKLGAEFKLLKDTLEKETKAREQADDDIVKALNHYTVALQNALRIANA